MSATNVSPFGVQRTVTVEVNGFTFTYRRPSRFDESEINRLYAGKVSSWGRASAVETQQRAFIDGNDLLWDSRFAICLRPAIEDGKVMDRGETAPAHWLTTQKQPGADDVTVISFDKVDPAEHRAVAAALAVELEKKVPVTPRSSEPAREQKAA